MTTIKKTVAFFMSLMILLSVACVGAGAESEKAPEGSRTFVFVHGFGGWGDYDEYNNQSHYWGGDADVTAILREQGYEAYAASVGPFSSAWDRACELYAQLTGTVVDYGEAHSKACSHERYGKSFQNMPLMGENWDLSESINLVGHSFGGMTARLFASLLAYGDEDERKASGESVSPLFAGGHAGAVHSVTTLAGVHNGTQLANLFYDIPGFIYVIGFGVNLLSVLGVTLPMGDINLGHYAITAKQGESRAKLSLCGVKNFGKSGDNVGYDLTVRGARELNEKIRTVPEVYYYSYTGYLTEENQYGYQQRTADCAKIFNGTCDILTLSRGLIVDGVKMTDEWTANDGLVPVASGIYPMNCADIAFSYEEAEKNGEIRPGAWYYHQPLYGIDHGDYCYEKSTLPGGFEGFYLEIARIASK
ncbi:MAG: esterase/lipase family protein [Acutalibacteraceae bacterium]